MLIILTVIVLICVAVAYLAYDYWNSYESFVSETPYSEGKHAFDNVHMNKDYFYEYLPSYSRKLLKFIQSEIDSAVKTNPEKDSTDTTEVTFSSELQKNEDIKKKYVVGENNVIMASTKLGIYLNVEKNFGVSTEFDEAPYLKTSSNITRNQFVDAIINNYFQNYMIVNALDSYFVGRMSMFNIMKNTSDSEMGDDDAVVSEASSILQMVRKYISLNPGAVKEKIPSFSMTRVHQSIQDRLEAKAEYMFRLMSEVDITKPDVIDNKSAELEKLAIKAEDIQLSLKSDSKALKQVQSYKYPFMVALFRSFIMEGGSAPELVMRRNKNGEYVYFASRTGVSASGVNNQTVIPVTGDNYTPNALVRIGETGHDAYKTRLGQAFVIMMKNLNANNVMGTVCNKNGLVLGEKLNCSHYNADVKDVELVKRMVYYVFGMYSDAQAKSYIDTELKKLREFNSDKEEDWMVSYRNKGLLNTDEMNMLNGVDHRLNFIGPYTSSLRCVIGNLKSGITNETSNIRQELSLLNNESGDEPESFDNYSYL